MGGGNPTWINDYFNGELVVFPDDTDWRIGTQISEKYDFLEAERTGLEADLAESQVVCRCHQVAGPDVGRAGIMKIRIQYAYAQSHSEAPKCILILSISQGSDGVPSRWQSGSAGAGGKAYSESLYSARSQHVDLPQ